MVLVDSVTGAARTLAGGPPSYGQGDLPVFRGSLSPDGGGPSTGYEANTHSFWTIVNIGDGSTTVDAYDVVTQTTTRWFQTAGFVQMVGADGAGHPIVQYADRDIFHVDPAQRAGITTRTMLLTAPNQPQVLNTGIVGAANVADHLSPLSVTDRDTVWMAADNGQIWRDTPATGMQLVLRVSTSTRGAPGVVISGPCR